MQKSYYKKLYYYFTSTDLRIYKRIIQGSRIVFNNSLLRLCGDDEELFGKESGSLKVYLHSYFVLLEYTVL